LRLRVEAILKAHEHPGSFLQSPAIPMSGREGPAEERASRTELLRTGERPNGMHWANTNGCTLLLTGATRDVFSGREFVVAESRRAGPAYCMRACRCSKRRSAAYYGAEGPAVSASRHIAACCGLLRGRNPRYFLRRRQPRLLMHNAPQADRSD
jgi:hypothetical protein